MREFSRGNLIYNKENRILNDTDLKDTFGVTDFTSPINFKSAISKVQPLLDRANISLAAAQAYKSDENISQAVNDALAVLGQNITALNYCYTALQNSVVSNLSSPGTDNTDIANIVRVAGNGTNSWVGEINIITANTLYWGSSNGSIRFVGFEINKLVA